MAKSKNAPAAKTAAAPATEEVKTETPAAETKVPLAKMRGPRGVAESAKITVLTDGGKNPKRPGSKAFAAFACYKDGMTVGEFCDAVNAVDKVKGLATIAMVYDASHGFIKIEGYDPEVTPVKVREPKAPKPAKEPKAKKEKAPSKVAEQAAADAEAAEEVID